MDINQLKSKYAPVIDALSKPGTKLTNVHLQDGKLFIGGNVSSEAAKNEVWNLLKKADAAHADVIADIKIDPALASAVPKAPAEEHYTVVAGDTLSAISKRFYGDANKYQRIFEANRDILKDPDHIKPGQSLKIPAA